jgi:excisionase family DNA binding protein
MSEPEFLNISACARALGVSRPTVYALIKQGHIQVKRLGHLSMVDMATVRRHIASLPLATTVSNGRRRGALRTMAPIGRDNAREQ